MNTTHDQNTYKIPYRLCIKNIHAKRGHLCKSRVKDQLKGMMELAGQMVLFYFLAGPWVTETYTFIKTQ